MKNAGSLTGISVMSNTTTLRVPDAVKADGYFYWIPPFTPHWDDWMGPYDTWDEAEDVCYGLQETINSPQWQLMLVDMQDEFEEEWNRKLKRGASALR